jgi:hypothetical protein
VQVGVKDKILGVHPSHSAYKSQSYSLFTHNCNNFSEEVAQFLVNKSIPREILEMPSKILNTPFGKLIEAQFSNFQINPQ